MAKANFTIFCCRCILIIYILAGEDTRTFIPLVGPVDLSYGYWILAAIVIVGIVNAVNFTDGIDGLNTSVTFCCIIFMLIGTVINTVGISLLSVCVAGGCMGFWCGTLIRPKYLWVIPALFFRWNCMRPCLWNGYAYFAVSIRYYLHRRNFICCIASAVLLKLQKENVCLK